MLDYPNFLSRHFVTSYHIFRHTDLILLSLTKIPYAWISQNTPIKLLDSDYVYLGYGLISKNSAVLSVGLLIWYIYSKLEKQLHINYKKG